MRPSASRAPPLAPRSVSLENNAGAFAVDFAFLFMDDIADAEFWVRPCQVMEWSNEASLALIDEYKRHPALWDIHHQSYSSKGQKQEAWEVIAADMELDVHEVKQKMNSLLGSFRREKSKMRKNRESIGGQGYCPRWFAFEKMQFLLRDDDTDIAGMKFEEEEDSFFDELRYPLQEPLEVTQAERKPSNVPVPPPKRVKKFVKAASDPVLDDLSIFPPQDEYSAFGQYIACKLRKFEPRTRAYVEHAVNNVLFEADIGKYDSVAWPLASADRIGNSP